MGGHRLFDEHVFAGLEGGDGDGAVEVMGGADVDGVEGGIGEDVGELAVDFAAHFFDAVDGVGDAGIVGEEVVGGGEDEVGIFFRLR